MLPIGKGQAEYSGSQAITGHFEEGRWGGAGAGGVSFDRTYEPINLSIFGRRPTPPIKLLELN